MSSSSVSVLKFVGTVSLGLLTVSSIDPQLAARLDGPMPCSYTPRAASRSAVMAVKSSHQDDWTDRLFDFHSAFYVCLFSRISFQEPPYKQRELIIPSLCF